MYQRERDHDHKAHDLADGLSDLAATAKALGLNDYAGVLDVLADGVLLRLDAVDVPIHYLPALTDKPALSGVGDSPDVSVALAEHTAAAMNMLGGAS